MHRVVLIPENGLGPEVTCAREVIDASGTRIEGQVAPLQVEHELGAPKPDTLYSRGVL